MGFYNTIFFVGNDNTSRSVMSEGIMKKITAGSQCKVFSRGTVVLFPEPFNEKVEEVLKRHECPVRRGHSELLSRDELDEETLVLTISFADKLKILEDFEWTENVYTLAEFIEEEFDLVDPYGGEMESYEECYRELNTILNKVWSKIRKEG